MPIERLMLILGITAQAMLTPTPEPYPLVQVTAIALRIRERPTIESAQIGTLFSGTVVPVLREKDGWYKVQYADLRGWISAQWAVPVEKRELFHDPAEAQDFVSWEVDCDDLDAYNGYYFHGYCLPGLITPESALVPYPQHAVGRAAVYYDGIMALVAQNRGLSLKGYKGGVALESCAEVGRAVWLRFVDWEGPFLVVDCGARYGLFRVVAYSGYAVEVGHSVYTDLVEAGEWRNTAQVCFGPPASCDGSPVDFRSYWLSRIEYEVYCEVHLC